MRIPWPREFATWPLLVSLDRYPFDEVHRTIARSCLAAGIAQVESLEQVELDGTPITDSGLAKLKALPNLRLLSLNRTTKLTDKAVETLPTKVVDFSRKTAPVPSNSTLTNRKPVSFRIRNLPWPRSLHVAIARPAGACSSCR